MLKGRFEQYTHMVKLINDLRARVNQIETDMKELMRRQEEIPARYMALKQQHEHLIKLIAWQEDPSLGDEVVTSTSITPEDVLDAL